MLGFRTFTPLWEFGTAQSQLSPTTLDMAIGQQSFVTTCAQVICALVLEGQTYVTTKLKAVRAAWALPRPLRTVIHLKPFSMRTDATLSLLFTETGLQ